MEYLRLSVPDVILTDIKMSKNSGLDIARYVLEHQIHTQIVFMSAYREFDYAQKAIEYGVVHYLVKPVPLPRIREVFQCIRQKLDERSVQEGASLGEPGKETQKQHKLSKAEKSKNRVLNYIQEHYKEDLNLTTISQELYLNSGYISRMLKEQTGKNFTDILAEIRVEKAVWLLENTDLYVYEIAAEVGYQNLKYFYQIFKKITGKTPNDYRREYET